MIAILWDGDILIHCTKLISLSNSTLLFRPLQLLSCASMLSPSKHVFYLSHPSVLFKIYDFQPLNFFNLSTPSTLSTIFNPFNSFNLFNSSTLSTPSTFSTSSAHSIPFLNYFYTFVRILF